MKLKDIIITFILVVLISILFVIDKKYEYKNHNVNSGYLVYLKGKEFGLIKNEDELYNIINDEQDTIKTKYNVDKVYPPKEFEIVKVNTYQNNYTDENLVYDELKKIDNFAIKGYTITIKFPKNEEKDPIQINVLDKKIFEDAIENFVTAFISKGELNDYINNNERELNDIGKIIKTMYFNEIITIKENLISVKDKIYTDVESLSQYLLFGEDAKMNSYIVKLGDDIKSISDAHKINTKEFMIANPKYRNENTVLPIGTKVNVTILNPVLTYIYEVYKIEETKIRYNHKTVVDKSKDSSYKEITTPGITGITRNHENYQVINGEPSKEVKMTYEVIRDKVDQITTVGRPKWSGISGGYVPSDGYWGWPTNQPYVLTSPYGYRCLRGKCYVHEGIDISGTGFRSPIYSVQNGEVVEVSRRKNDGLYIIIRHENNIYSQYAHLNKQNVVVGQKVVKGDVIGEMGATGYVTGVHLHFGLSYGWPYHGQYTFKNPYSFYGAQ